jgi:hypothetical protein
MSFNNFQDMTAAADYNSKSNPQKILLEKKIEFGIDKNFVFNNIVKIKNE